jgi:hypothetical protein
MANKNNKTNIKDERIEDTTMYGEFISSFHNWNTPDRQRKVARHLEDVTEVFSELTDNNKKNDTKRSN